MQLSLIDPREHPVVTGEMIDDPHLKSAIQFVRDSVGIKVSHPDQVGFCWPFARALVSVNGRMAWAVDDIGMRYVAIGKTVFKEDDLRFVADRVREAAEAVFSALDDMDAIGRAA